LDFALVVTLAFVASGLTLYSGFGLGTLLLPAFALFFPVPVAVAATGAVHLINNLFKGALLWRKADWPIVLRFGLPAVPAAVAGAWLLGSLGATGRLFSWDAAGRTFGPTAAGMAVGALMIAFALIELQPAFRRLRAPARLLPVGGLVTGFLGGLTGQQGALRSAFLLKSGMDAAGFIATGVMIAVLVDLSRMPTYLAAFAETGVALGTRDLAMIAAGTLAALAGALIGARHVEKVTIDIVRRIVAALMVLVGLALAAGVIG
jgi:hypothetical protein